MKLLFCLIWFCIISRPAVSQAIAAMQTDSAISHPSDTLRPVSVRKGRLATVVVGESIFYAGSMAFLQFIWYKDDARVPFTFYNDAAGCYPAGALTPVPFGKAAKDAHIRHVKVFTWKRSTKFLHD